MKNATPLSVGDVVAKTISFTTPLELDNGGALAQVDLTYETYGELNEAGDNAVLICHALSSDHHAAGTHAGDKKSIGWWDALIGPNKPIDTQRFFVVCSNNIGGCSGSTGPSSINQETGMPFGPDFPLVTVTDWVECQKRLFEYLNIQRWAAVIGGSLGGMQVLEWSTRYPKLVTNAVIIASAAKLSAQNIGFNNVARQAIRSDPNFHGGNYYQHNIIPSRGLTIARMLGHMTYLSDDLMATKFGRMLREKKTLELNVNSEFEIESYLRYQGEQFVHRFDANTYLLMTKALDHFDPAANHNESLTQALSSATANFLVLSFSSDWRFAPERSIEIVRALQTNNLNVSYAEINSPHGHDSFLIQNESYFKILGTYMARVSAELYKSKLFQTAI